MKFLKCLECEGGHILILFLLFVACMTLAFLHPDNKPAAQSCEMILGALLFAMKGNKNETQK